MPAGRLLQLCWEIEEAELAYAKKSPAFHRMDVEAGLVGWDVHILEARGLFDVPPVRCFEGEDADGFEESAQPWRD